MKKGTEEIIEEIAREEGLSVKKVKYAVNHFFGWQRESFKKKEYYEYNWQGVGKFTMGLHDIKDVDDVTEAYEHKTKKSSNFKTLPDFKEKDLIIQRIKEYSYKNLVGTEYDSNTYLFYKSFRKVPTKEAKGYNYYSLQKNCSIEELETLLKYLETCVSK